MAIIQAAPPFVADRLEKLESELKGGEGYGHDDEEKQQDKRDREDRR